RWRLPGTAISCVHISAVSNHPSSRAATAGNSALRSGVVLKIALAISSTRRSLAATICSSSSLVASRIAVRVFASGVVGPRMPRQQMVIVFPFYVGKQKGRGACCSTPSNPRYQYLVNAKQPGPFSAGKKVIVAKEGAVVVAYHRHMCLALRYGATIAQSHV